MRFWIIICALFSLIACGTPNQVKPASSGARCFVAVRRTPPDSLGKFMMRATTVYNGPCRAIVEDGSLVMVTDSTTEQPYYPEADRERRVRCVLVRMETPTFAVAHKSLFGLMAGSDPICPIQDRTSPVLYDLVSAR